jgi:RNA polymerase sigma factor (sigma-70 family)
MTPEELAEALEAKRPEMIRVASARLRRHGLEYEAEDFVQEAFIKILGGVAENNYTFAEGIGGLFTTTLITLIQNRIRDTRRRDVLTDEYTRIYQPDSQAHIQQRERLKLDVSLALDKLPDARTRAVVRLIWMEEHTHLQTAKILKCSTRDTLAALATALPILQAALARYDHRQRQPSVPALDRLGVSPSRPPYKEETDETDPSTALQAATSRDEINEMDWAYKHTTWVYCEPAGAE